MDKQRKQSDKVEKLLNSHPETVALVFDHLLPTKLCTPEKRELPPHDYGEIEAKARQKIVQPEHETLAEGFGKGWSTAEDIAKRREEKELALQATRQNTTF